MGVPYSECDNTHTDCALNRSVTESLGRFILIYLLLSGLVDRLTRLRSKSSHSVNLKNIVMEDLKLSVIYACVFNLATIFDVCIFDSGTQFSSAIIV